ncbi:MAG: hypothetical protein DCC55_31185 [Chloroflexi bacterium]|nr:MAG: hypothetical protein DCC55_31185 [Chloroflexota bacterium]
MAWAAGLEITIETALVTGSHTAYKQAIDAGLEITAYAANATDRIGKITGGPCNPPMTYSLQPEAIQRVPHQTAYLLDASGRRVGQRSLTDKGTNS